MTRVEQWLLAQGELPLSEVPKSTFYSDSINDLPLLERVTHPVATNSYPRLRAVANERNWPLLELFND